MINRRTFLRNCAGFSAFALVAELSAAATPPASLAGRRWVSQHRELARSLKAGTLSQVQWHERVNSLAHELDLEQLAAELRRARIRDAGAPFGGDPQKRFVTMLDDQGQPLKLGYGLALFDFRANSVITPHAHKHMVSAHMVIDGTVRVRTFDRIRDEDGALVIRPTSDVIAEPGYSAAMTTPKDNVHWFVPKTARAVGPQLGALRTDETGLPTGTGVPSTGDEDGVTFAGLRIGATGSLKADVRNVDAANAKLDVWIDFNNDQDFDDAGEQVVIGKSVTQSGLASFDIAVPVDATAGNVVARVRISRLTDAALTPAGTAPSGEVYLNFTGSYAGSNPGRPLLSIPPSRRHTPGFPAPGP